MFLLTDVGNSILNAIVVFVASDNYIDNHSSDINSGIGSGVHIHIDIYCHSRHFHSNPTGDRLSAIATMSE